MAVAAVATACPPPPHTSVPLAAPCLCGGRGREREASSVVYGFKERSPPASRLVELTRSSARRQHGSRRSTQPLLPSPPFPLPTQYMPRLRNLLKHEDKDLDEEQQQKQEPRRMALLEALASHASLPLLPPQSCPMVQSQTLLFPHSPNTHRHKHLLALWHVQVSPRFPPSHPCVSKPAPDCLPFLLPKRVHDPPFNKVYDPSHYVLSSCSPTHPARTSRNGDTEHHEHVWPRSSAAYPSYYAPRRSWRLASTQRSSSDATPPQPPTPTHIHPPHR